MDKSKGKNFNLPSVPDFVGFPIPDIRGNTTIRRRGLRPAVFRFAASCRVCPDSVVADGPLRTLAGDLGCCGTARQTGHSLHRQNRLMGEFGTFPTFAASAPMAGFGALRHERHQPVQNQPSPGRDPIAAMRREKPPFICSGAKTYARMTRSRTKSKFATIAPDDGFHGWSVFFHFFDTKS